ncbi:MAG: RHS repeat domain-containing protein, partial [Candidatus Contendobacter sp.]|nr:RHS repeat domain-containing protein [Candidatus Contendobacter sp.]
MTNRIWRIGLLVLLAFAAAAHAGQERYDYDALGRLIRFVNPAGEVTEYVYDAVGNILEVRRAEVQPPQITGVAPNSVSRGKTTVIVVSGTGLLGATVTTADPGLRVTGLRSAQAEVSFDLAVAETVPLGAHLFTLSSPTGTAGFNLTVKPALPTVAVTPSPVVLPPGGTQDLRISLSGPDVEDHQLAPTVTDPTVATVPTAALDFPAGQTEASLTVTGGALGNTILDLASATLESVKVGIFVSRDEGPGDRMRLAKSVGVLRERPAAGQPIGPFVAPDVGVLREPPAAGQPIGPFVAPDVGVL